MHLGQTRKVYRGVVAKEIYPHPGQSDACHSGRRGKQEVLRQRVPDKPPLWGAEGAAYGGLPVAGKSASELGIRQIHTGDEHEPDDGSHQEPQACFGIADHNFLHGLHGSHQRAWPIVPLVRGHFLQDLGLDRGQLRLRLPDADPRPEAREGNVVAVVAVPAYLAQVEDDGEEDGRFRHAALGLPGAKRWERILVGQTEAGWQDADHFARDVAHSDLLADRVPVAIEQALPEGVGQNGDTVAAFDAIFREEAAAEQRRHLKDVQQVRIRRDRPYQAWVLRAEGQAACALTQNRQAAECRRSFLPEVHVARIGSDGIRRQQPNALPGDHKIAAIAIGQRLQNDRIDDGEDRSARADAESQRQYRGRREPRALPQHPQSIADVLNRYIPTSPTPHFAYLLQIG